MGGGRPRQEGKDYGWNICEGRHDNPLRAGSVDRSTRFEPPIHEYGHDTGCNSITGAAFVPDGASCAGNDAYLFGDYVRGKIFKLTRNAGGGYDATTFATNLGQRGPVAMTFGKVGGFRDVYYTTYAGKNGGQVRHIAPTLIPTGLPVRSRTRSVTTTVRRRSGSSSGARGARP